MMLETLRQDYIRTAWSKGTQRKVVVIRPCHEECADSGWSRWSAGVSRRSSAVSVINRVYLSTFPVMGRLMIDALNGRDYPIISAINLIMPPSSLPITCLST